MEELTISPQPKSSAKRAKKEKAPKEDDLEGTGCFSRPTLNTKLWTEDEENRKSFDMCFASGCYSYVLSRERNELYSWGIGYSYVLGTREEDNEFTPYKVHPKMFEEN